MFTVVVDIIVKADRVDQFREAVLAQGQNSRANEPGCLGFDILQDPDNQTCFTLYETYVNAPTFYEVHRTTPYFLDYAEATAPWVASKRVRTLTRIWPGPTA